MLCGHPSAKRIVRIVLERPGLVCAAHHEQCMRDHEVNQTKPEHPLTWRSVQIALGMSASGISPSLRCQLRQPPELSSQRNLYLFKHGYFLDWRFRLSCGEPPGIAGPRAGASNESARAAGSRNDSRSRQEKWWSQTGSNRRPHACKARALPAELWPPPSPRLRCGKPRSSKPSRSTLKTACQAEARAMRAKAGGPGKI
jgi:hypothetical protein